MSDIISQKTARVGILVVIISNLQIAIQLFEQRINLIYEEQQQLQMLRGAKLANKKRQIRHFYIQIVRPIIVLPLVIHYLVQFNNDGLSMKEIVMSAPERYQRTVLFMVLHIGLSYCKTLILLVIILFSLVFSNQSQFFINVMQAFTNFTFDLIESGLLLFNIINIGLISFKGVNLRQIGERIKQFIENMGEGIDDSPEIIEGEEQFLPQQDKDVPDRKEKPAENIDMAQRRTAQRLFISDLIDFYYQCKNTSKSFNKFVLALKSLKRLVNFPVPTLKDLYGVETVE